MYHFEVRQIVNLSFIGMSGIGKSHWSSLLEQQGFRRFCCDALIEARLLPELTQPDGRQLDMGQWMGFPYQADYQAREQQYLAYEIAVMHEVLDELERAPTDAERSTIVDTTGSVIYTNAAILERLAAVTQIVYLEAPPVVQQAMCQAYVADPAPVLWRDQFQQLPHESNEAALARCYPHLLSSRRREYEQLADITLDYHLLRTENFGVTDFLYQINQSVPHRNGEMI